MRILVCDPWFCGSRAAFINALAHYSRHEFHRLSQEAGSPEDWARQVRQAPLMLSQQAEDLQGRWDVVLCADNLNIAEWKALAPSTISSLPHVSLQMTMRLPEVRDARSGEFSQSVCTTLWNAIVADHLLFLSDYHRREFLRRVSALLKQYPVIDEDGLLLKIQKKVRYMEQGLDLKSFRKAVPESVATQKTKPLVLWLHPWRSDYGPDLVFEALKILREEDCPFQLAVLGGPGDDVPDVFDALQEDYGDDLLQFGFVENREDYLQWLRLGDIVISAAHHEPVDSAVLEAIAAGCAPLLPNRLSYPELFDSSRYTWALYDGKDDFLIKLRRLLNTEDFSKLNCESDIAHRDWDNQIRRFDDFFLSL